MEPLAPQWEYCQLVFIGARMLAFRPLGAAMTIAEAGPTSAPMHRPPSTAPSAAPTESHYHLQIVFAGPDGTVIERQLAAFEQTRAQNPFYEAIGLLGGAGWELVAMEPGRDHVWAVEEREVVPYTAGLRPVSRTAHFKRRAAQGRRVDEPTIELRAQ